MSEMYVGRVKWFAHYGYGFLEHPDIDGDIMVHHSIIQEEGFKKLKEGETVRFTLAEPTEKGHRAEKVWRLR